MRDHFYWAPLICWLRGMRPEEVLRLLKSDVFERAGILCFRVEQCPESGAMNRPGFTGELVVQ